MRILSEKLFRAAIVSALLTAFFADAADFSVVNNGMTSYTINNSDNPALTLQRGLTYTFSVNSPGHPFDIKTNASTGTANRYTNGVAGQGATGGTLTFAVPTNAPNTLHYNCEVHSAMTGIINIIAPLPVTFTNAAIISNKFIFTIAATANHTNVIQVSTNLAPANWIPLKTNFPSASSFNFTDAVSAQFSNRFYRVVEP